MAFRGISIPKSFLWFCDCGLFREVRLLEDRRPEARADFQLELSTKGRAAYERAAQALPKGDVQKVEDTFNAACAPERERLAQVRFQCSGNERGVLEGRIFLESAGRREAREFLRVVEEFKAASLRRAVANAHRGPRPKLVEVEFVGGSENEDEYDPLQAPEDLYVVVELPRHASPGKLAPIRSRSRGYAPRADGRALAEIVVGEVQRELPPGTDLKTAVERVTGLLEHPSEHPALDQPVHPFLEETMRAYASEPIRLVSATDRPMLIEAFTAFFDQRLSYAKIARRLNEKGYKSDQGKLFSAALAEHIVIQALLMVGAWELKETTVETDS